MAPEIRDEMARRGETASTEIAEIVSKHSMHGLD